MSKLNILSKLAALFFLAAVLVSCVGQQPQQDAGIPPAEATIWALNTQIAQQATNAAVTLTAVANENQSAAPSDVQQPAATEEPVALIGLVSPTASSSQDPFSIVVDPALAPNGVTVPCVVKATKVDLRIGPDLRFPFAGQHLAGENCEIFARYYNWFYVKFPAANNNNGWLYIDWLTIPDPSALSQIPQIAVNPDWKWARGCKKYCR